MASEEDPMVIDTSENDNNETKSEVSDDVDPGEEADTFSQIQEQNEPVDLTMSDSPAQHDDEHVPLNIYENFELQEIPHLSTARPSQLTAKPPGKEPMKAQGAREGVHTMGVIAEDPELHKFPRRLQKVKLILNAPRHPDFTADQGFIRNASFVELVERQDNGRLLMKLVLQMDVETRDDLKALLRTSDPFLNDTDDDEHQDDLQEQVWDALVELRAWKFPEAGSEMNDLLMRLAGLFVMWITCTPPPEGDNGLPASTVKKAMKNKDQYGRFYESLVKCLDALNTSQSTGKPRKSGGMNTSRALTNKDKRSISIMSDTDIEHPAASQHTPHKKRKRAVQESQEAKRMRIKDRQRVMDQEERRKVLQATFTRKGINDGDPSKILVNEGKLETEGFIYLHPHIGARIKPHQIDGVQFMWRELVAGQGCLLAHTMGLGKTMQV